MIATETYGATEMRIFEDERGDSIAAGWEVRERFCYVCGKHLVLVIPGDREADPLCKQHDPSPRDVGTAA